MRPFHSTPPAPAEEKPRARVALGGPRCWGSLCALLLTSTLVTSLWSFGPLEVETRATSTESSADGVDDASDAKSRHQRWKRQEVRVVLDSSLNQLGPNAEALVRRAFEAWNDTGARLPVVVFESGDGTEASLEPDGKSTILVSNIDIDGHETDLAITVGFSNPSSGEISEADIVINAAHLFSHISAQETEESVRLAQSQGSPAEQRSCSGQLDARACGESYDLQNVLTHEVGHFFGLGENYDDPRATMFSCTSSCEIHKRDLSPVDDAQIHELYAEQEEPVPQGCAGVQIGGHPRLVHHSSWYAWLAVGFGLAWMRRRRATPSLRTRRE